MSKKLEFRWLFTTILSGFLAMAVSALTIQACSSSGSSDEDAAAEEEADVEADAAAGAMIMAVFGADGGESSSVTAKLQHYVNLYLLSMRVAIAQETSDSACEMVSTGGDDNITMSDDGTAGTYGSATSALGQFTVGGSSSNQFCADDGEVGTWCVGSGCEGGSSSDNFSMSCTLDGATSTASLAGSGVMTLASGIVNVYGTFSLTIGSSSSTDLRCSFAVDQDGGEPDFAANCENSDGTPIPQDSDLSCEGSDGSSDDSETEGDSGDSGGDDSDEEGDEAEDGLSGSVCTSDADCSGADAAAGQSAICASFDGESRCVVTCVTDADCAAVTAESDDIQCETFGTKMCVDCGFAPCS